MKTLPTKIVFLIIIGGFLVSCAGSINEATILDAEYFGVDMVKITINGDWTDYSLSSGFIYIYGETSDTYYYIKDVFDLPGWRFADQQHTFRATIYPQFKHGDKILVFGMNGVFGGVKFTVPE
jgi:hypothetical protein